MKFTPASSGNVSLQIVFTSPDPKDSVMIPVDTVYESSDENSPHRDLSAKSGSSVRLFVGRYRHRRVELKTEILRSDMGD